MLSFGKQEMLPAAAWLQLARLQFYPMAFLAYSLGSCVVWLEGKSLDAGLFFLGYLTMFCIELGTVLTNEVHDQDTDSLNRNRSFFSGGSGILVSGRLSDVPVRRAAGMCFAAAVCMALITPFVTGGPAGWKVEVYLIGGVGLGMGYTVPPVRLSGRGWGEVTVGFTHSFLLIGYGCLLQTGNFFGSAPLFLSLPVFFSVLAAILLAGLPDMGADRKAGKKTLAVRLGPQTVVVLAAGSSLLSVLAIVPLVSVAILSPTMGGWFLFCSGVHALVLLTVLARMVRRRVYDVRIDIVLQLALSHILWTVLFPLAAMEGSV